MLLTYHASPSTRVGYTSDEDTLLMKYIATYNPTKQNRSGNVLYKRLVENVSFSNVYRVKQILTLI